MQKKVIVDFITAIKIKIIIDRLQRWNKKNMSK